MLYTINNLIEYYEKFDTETLKERNEKLLQKNIDTIFNSNIYSIKTKEWKLYNKILIQLNKHLAAISIILNRRGL